MYVGKGRKREMCVPLRAEVSQEPIESILSFYYVCPKDRTQVVRLDYVKHLCLNNFRLNID